MITVKLVYLFWNNNRQKKIFAIKNTTGVFFASCFGIVWWQHSKAVELVKITVCSKHYTGEKIYKERKGDPERKMEVQI
jgi:hypothetical protein